MNTLAGKTALVTGGSRGIGLAIAQLLAQAGARVAICGRSDPSLAAAAALIVGERKDAEVMWARCDVTHFGDCRHLHAAVDARFGVPDVLVNNAGVVERAPLHEMTEAQWDHVVGANLKGTFNITRVFLPQMRARFGCGAGGDALKFVMDVDHLTFAEAVERLAGRAGVQLRYVEAGPAPRFGIPPRQLLPL